MTREEAEGWLVQLLLEKVREDPYPSQTHMDMIEETIRPEMLEEYLDVLIEKAQPDTWPSIPMLQRIQRVAASVPEREV